jgi:DNA-binding MarR family transcriptional regulator
MLDVKTLEPENSNMTRSTVEVRDSIDEKLEVWLREIPDLDARTEGVVDRVGVIQKYLRRTHDETLDQFGLVWGDVKVLGSLRYGGPPYRSTPGKLGSQLGLSSGAMTSRLDKMEEAELIRRLPDPGDRRGVVIELTEHGREIWEQTIAVQAEKESIVAAALSKAEQDQLNDLLRRLVIAFEDEYGPLSRRRH